MAKIEQCVTTFSSRDFSIGRPILFLLSAISPFQETRFDDRTKKPATTLMLPNA
ncbi:hypothetical protein QTL95_23445 [Rhizobium sp. S152]|uniref:hypothetical protein n=1 Tax=Rhizobium sp. S152 TaxID=3055038 RepID=UPI0025AA17C5|nr:hypothetical protein [Rhizobium sp. S152]MDM9628856.1 hypothetical protein [Rhizobium sp. S152]